MHPRIASGATGKSTAPYGSWESPISAAVVSAAGRTAEGFAIAGDGRLVWVETRPEDGGRAVLVKEAAGPGGKALDVTPQGFAVRSLAQEYGGGAFAVQGDTVVFSNYTDQRLYRQTIGDNSPLPLTPDYGPVVRYADGVFDPHFHRFVTIMEDHRHNSSNPITTIVAVGISDPDVKEYTMLVSGNDFYAFPRIDPTKKRMAWIEWSNPNMSWDKSQLWVGYFNEKGEIKEKICVAGGDPTIVESPTEPKWSSKGELFFITDRRSGFWNIYKWDEHSRAVTPLHSLDAEFSKPMWIFGVSSYGFLGIDDTSHKIVCSYRMESHVGVLDQDSESFLKIDIPFSSVTNIVVSGDRSFYIEGASATLPVSIAKVTLDEKRTMATDFSIVWSSSEDVAQYESYFSLPEFVEFPNVINGYGREFRERLLAQWGVVDVNDCCSCAAFLIADLASLRAGMHKFEAYYIDNLVGNKQAYFERSPINFVENFSCPVILFQGLEDTVVSPDQATKIYKAIKDKGLPVALVEYEGEQHGFRKAENIKFTLEQEMVFLARLVGEFKVPDDITPIKIENFD
ncbi:alpha/beta-Hydrolases superfamily protein [Zea mays]|uniref:Alpha/beta-Hydrolases superfamily protein n=1 Tax=Zea mays TaxID=4577 RepID=A0A1D6NS70_MAIZE|nr:alpha/beta-Hydrolases superfamily protein [Zea mays]